jgi:uncharacterized protein (TIGR02099 family)
MSTSPTETPFSSDTANAPRQRRLSAALSALLRWLAGLMAVVFGLLVIAWLVIHWTILPHIENWRGTVEQRATAALGVPVRIGGITVTSSGWVPAFELRDVALLGPDAQPALSLPRVVAALSPRSLLALELRFEQLLIENAQLDVQRDAQGRLRVAGLDMSAPSSAPAEDAALVTDWFFKQHELVIRGASVRWTDAQRSAAPLVLSQVQFVMRNGLRQHDFRLDGTPPAEWGDRFSVSGKFTQPLLARPGDWQRWSGAVHADLPKADLRELRRHVDLPLDLSQGQGAVRAWLEVRNGKLTEGVADVALRTVVLRLAPQLQALNFEHLQGRLTVQQSGDTLRLSAQKFSFAAEGTDGQTLQWPRSDMSLALRCERSCAPGEAVNSGEFTAQRLDLGLMNEVAQRLPLTDGMRRHLSELRPQGLVTGLTAQWAGPVDAPSGYQVKALFSGFSLAARPSPLAATDATALGRPGLSGATVELSANEKGGQAQITLAPGGTVDLPGVFAEAVVPFEQLSSLLQWRIEPGKTIARSTKTAGSADSPALPKITLNIKSARFANADVQGELTGSWATGPGEGFAKGARFPGDLEINGKLSRGVAMRTARYLPLGLPVNVRNYVARAVQGGTLSAVSFRVKGDLWDFPYFEAASGKSLKDGKSLNEGHLHVAATLADVNFAYVPSLPASGAGAGAEAAFESPWPALSKVSGELVFDRAALEVRNAKARWAGLDITQVQGGIRSLADKSVLVIDGQARGPLADMLRFVNSSPVGDWTGKVLAQSSATGNAELKLGLNIPLFDVSSSSVNGSINVVGSELRVQPDNPLLSAVKGRVDFTQKGFTVVGGSARLWGGDVSFEGGSTPEGPVRFVGNGSISADGLRRASELGWVTQLAGALSGQTSYRAALGFTRSGLEIGVTSNLVGMAADLPAPLRKVSEAVLPLRYQTVMLPEGAGVSGGAGAGTTTARDQLRFELGSVVRAQYVRDVSGDTARVLRGGLSVVSGGQESVTNTAPTPPSGVTANINLPGVNFDVWDAAIVKLFGAGASAVANPVASPVIEATAAASATASMPSSSYFPTSVTLRTQELTAASRRLNRVIATASLEDGVWRSNVDAEQLSGYVEYRAGTGSGTSAPTTSARRSTGQLDRQLEPKGEAKIYARLSRLSLPRSELDEAAAVTAASHHTATAAATTTTANVPALDIVVDDFELRGKRLGRVEVAAANRVNTDGAREWALSRLVMTLPEAKLTATGSWAPVSGSVDHTRARKRMALDFKLDLADSGALLERLAPAASAPTAPASSASGSISRTNTKTLNGGKGVLAGQVAWLGSPLALDIPSLSGQMNLTLENGQFLKVETGAGRLLSVLSLQSLPRRMVLDFRDVFQQGFAFDNLVGDVSVSQGVARTNNLRMRGSLAAVLMEGSADIATESQNLRVIVVPEVNAGTASLAYAVINPAVGLATFLAQVFLRQPLMQANTREFQISGSWGDPKVERVERKLNEALPDMKMPDAKVQDVKPQDTKPAEGTTPQATEPASAAASVPVPVPAPVLQ